MLLAGPLTEVVPSIPAICAWTVANAVCNDDISDWRAAIPATSAAFKAVFNQSSHVLESPSLPSIPSFPSLPAGPVIAVSYSANM